LRSTLTGVSTVETFPDSWLSCNAIRALARDLARPAVVA
jgi:hypothetical protein